MQVSNLILADHVVTSLETIVRGLTADAFNFTANGLCREFGTIALINIDSSVESGTPGTSLDTAIRAVVWGIKNRECDAALSVVQDVVADMADPRTAAEEQVFHATWRVERAFKKYCSDPIGTVVDRIQSLA